MKQATCCGHTANCGCHHTCPNMLANGGIIKNNKKNIPHNCGNANCTLNAPKNTEEDISELYIKYRESRKKLEENKNIEPKKIETIEESKKIKINIRDI
jgi:hypothetical protein